MPPPCCTDAPVLAEGRRHFPDDGELMYMEAQGRIEQGDVAGAERLARELLAGRAGEHFASVDAALRGVKARHLLASSLLLQQKHREAEGQWREALVADPDYEPSWLGLGELFLREGRWGDVERVAARLGEAPEAEVLRGRAELARGEVAAARQTLERAANRFPAAAAPRVFLARALLHGGDAIAAERTLREAIAVEPGDSQARRELENLLRLQRSA